jgi:hypothetical protein
MCVVKELGLAPASHLRTRVCTRTAYLITGGLAGHSLCGHRRLWPPLGRTHPGAVALRPPRSWSANELGEERACIAQLVNLGCVGALGVDGSMYLLPRSSFVYHFQRAGLCITPDERTVRAPELNELCTNFSNVLWVYLVGASEFISSAVLG